jgi:glutamate-1-semialdehyde 2,1-aminomutase
VRFCGAYHGWWGDVQPGIGNPMPQKDTYTLAEMSERALDVLATRGDIACVLINPLQALHPNQPAPSDSGLIDSSRSAQFDAAAYTDWLEAVRKICTQRGIVLIFDEVFTGFRLARGGAQELFGVSADLVTYGKSLGGGLPIGALCGQAALMKRFRDSRPADICFARGTFNSHPYVMAAMEGFLNFLEQPDAGAVYEGLSERWAARLQWFNQQLGDAGVPVRAAALSSIWTILYDTPSRYNWMLQYYLRTEGLALSWVGTGRLIFPINLSADDFQEITSRFVRAASRMLADGWWWHNGTTTNQNIRRATAIEMLRTRLGFGIAHA